MPAAIDELRRELKQVAYERDKAREDRARAESDLEAMQEKLKSVAAWLKALWETPIEKNPERCLEVIRRNARAFELQVRQAAGES
jgi:predicted nuclease with TOPRIM domain